MINNQPVSATTPSRDSRWRPSTLRTTPSAEDRGMLGHPKGLPWMLNVEMWERFSYYGMRAILVYFIIDTVANGGLGIDEKSGAVIMAVYGAAVFLLAIPGAIFADRILGPWVSTLYGGLVIMAGHVALALPNDTLPGHATAWLGIALVAIGTGFIKPNLSTIVGGLYDEDDPRRDSGFQLFYMAINIGSLVSPLLTGWLKDKYGYHIGFLAAAIGMAFALVAFVYGRHKLSAFAFDVPNPLDRKGLQRLALGTVVVILVAAAALWLLVQLTKGDIPGAVAYLTFGIAIIASISYFTMMFRSAKVTDRERGHLTAYIPLWIGAVLFFMIFEQASGQMAIFAKDHTNGRIVGNFGFSAEAYQSVNPATVVLLTPLFAWLFLRRAGKFPYTAHKFATAVVLIGISAAMMGFGFATWPGGGKMSPWWFLALVFVVQTIGELLLSPVGLSTTTALAPKAFASQAMALWLLASATGQGIAGVVLQLTKDLPTSTYYYGLAIATLIVAALLFSVARWTQSRMADVGVHE